MKLFLNSIHIMTMRIIPSAKQDTLSLTERVYQDLRTAIITGNISGGTRLVESNLATEMQVSRTPVREALHKLALEGLLYSIPRAGYIVEEMSDHDVEDLFDVRIKIEQMAARMALDKITPQEIRQLADNLAKVDLVLQNEQTQQMAKLDTEFHGIIYKAARSKTLYRICQTLSDHTLKYRIALIDKSEMGYKTRDGHYKIYEAIISGDGDRVDRAIQSHLELAKRDIRGLMRRTREESFVSQTGLR
jgi:DNA-binding GntR family transcriptional regulator